MLKLAGYSDEKVLAAIVGHELDPDRQAVCPECMGSDAAGWPLTLNWPVKRSVSSSRRLALDRVG